MKKLVGFLVLVCLISGIFVVNSCKKDVVIPSLTTTAITDITINSATAGGSITKDGGATVTARGVCWGTTLNPLISGSLTSDNTGTGSFTSSLTDLTPNTVYHVRAYATNKAGTAYGADVQFTTTAIVVPTLTTTAVTAITLTTAVSGGTITADGGGAVTARGVCWATTTAPTITNTITTDGAGTGSFTSNLTGLLPATIYYIRAYATNSAGTAYGTELSFTTASVAVPTLTTTAVTLITLTTAVSGGNITSDGGGAVTARGVCWATTANPVITNSKTTDGTGIGVFPSNLTVLLPGTAYHIRAYATNSAGTAYGADVPFTTSAVGLPTLTTTAVTAITLTTAASGGNITADGGGTVTARGVCWATTANPVIGALNTTTDGTGTGIFTSAITGLLPGTAYHLRAYATNGAGTAYGADVSFTTTAVVVPTLTTAAVTGITINTAISGGNISANGGAAVTARGVCWATTVDPTIGGATMTTDGTGSGPFISNLISLLPGTAYHVRAYATNSAGTAYGADVPFTTTSASLPTLTTAAVNTIALTSAVSGGNITANGGSTVTVSGLCWSLTANPVVTNFHTTDGTITGIFSSTMTGLTKGTQYYVRAYATNSAGTGYGNQLTFSTDIDDVDGNVYNTIPIGTQVWMAQNLKTTLFNNTNPIANVTASTGVGSWSVLTTAAYCWFNNDAVTYKPVYGALYNWFAVNTGNLCPTGFHVPTDDEFGTLEVYLGMVPADVTLFGVFRGTTQLVGSQMKNTTGWATGENGTNTSGWSALPGGYRYYVDGTFQAEGTFSYWWSSSVGNGTDTWYRRLDGSSNGVFRNAVNYKAGKYIRCVK